ncbi:DUF305 domain-containing protein [Nitrobacteraceae bacterium UC4446_H13]
MRFYDQIKHRTFALTVAFGLAASAFGLAHDEVEDESTSSSPEEETLLSENAAAMTKMMSDMAVKPTGDIDRDFVAMMVPHHTGAIDMAKAQLRYGKNEQLRRIAQEIIAEQLQKIAAMKLAIGEPLPPSNPSLSSADNAAPSQLRDDPATNPHHHMNMSLNAKR